MLDAKFKVDFIILDIWIINGRENEVKVVNMFLFVFVMSLCMMISDTEHYCGF